MRRASNRVSGGEQKADAEKKLLYNFDYHTTLQRDNLVFSANYTANTAVRFPLEFYLVCIFTSSSPTTLRPSSMSSMRNAVQRRNHRERGQLEGREKWGILEKHKVGGSFETRHDYS